MHQLGQILQQARLNKGFSKYHLQKNHNINPVFITRIEAGQSVDLKKLNEYIILLEIEITFPFK